MREQEPIRILLVEDDVVIRLGTQLLLDKELGFKVIGEAFDGITAVEKALALQPDVCLMDIGLPGQDGIEATRQIKAANPDIRVLILTAHSEDESIFAAFGAGADGYILKRPLGSNMLKALETSVRSVQFGSVWLDPMIARRVLFAANAHTKSSPVLTLVEEEVLETVASSNCRDGLCMVDPRFLSSLQRLAPRAS